MSCTDINDSDLLDRAWLRMELLFPDSEFLQDNCDIRLLQLSQLAPGAVDLHPVSRVGFSDFHNYVADTLSGKDVADYKLRNLGNPAL